MRNIVRILEICKRVIKNYGVRNFMRKESDFVGDLYL